MVINRQKGELNLVRIVRWSLCRAFCSYLKYVCMLVCWNRVKTFIAYHVLRMHCRILLAHSRQVSCGKPNAREYSAGGEDPLWLLHRSQKNHSPSQRNRDSQEGGYYLEFLLKKNSLHSDLLFKKINISTGFRNWWKWIKVQAVLLCFAARLLCGTIRETDLVAWYDFLHSGVSACTSCSLGSYNDSPGVRRRRETWSG